MNKILEIVEGRINGAIRELADINQLLAQQTGRVSVTATDLLRISDEMKANAQRAIHSPHPHKYDFNNDQWVEV